MDLRTTPSSVIQPGRSWLNTVLYTGIILSFIIALLPSCSPRERSVEHTFQVVTEDGIEVAVNSGGPRYTVPVFSFEYLFDIEQDDAREETLLYGFNWYMVGEDGRFYFTDLGNQRIAVFDSEGKYSHSFGRAGQGPGEFVSPRLLYAERDTAAVWDMMMGNWRISYFSPGGKFLTSTSIRQAALNTWGGWPGPGGSVIHSSSDYNILPSGPVPVRRVATMSVDNDTLGVVEVEIIDRPTTHFLSPLNVDYWWRHGILKTDGSEPVFNWYDLDGRLRQVIRIEGLVQEPVTEEERRAIREAGRSMLETAVGESSTRSLETRLEYPFPDVKPYWSSLTVDESGFIWARESLDLIRRTYAGKSCRIISPEGEYLGDVTFPEVEGLRQVVPSRGLLLAQVEDLETGAYDIGVYRIRPAVRGLVYP